MSPKKVGEAEKRMRELREAQVAEAAAPTPLSTADRERLAGLEATVKKGLASFLEVGAALAEIKESRLYREKYQTFADYCKGRWGMGRSHAYRLIDATTIVGEMSPRGDKMPESEKVVRPLKSLPPEDRDDAWEEAVERAGGEQPTAAVVAEVVEERKAPPSPEPDPEDDRPDHVPPAEDVEPDPYEQWERAEERVAKLEELVEHLEATDAGAEIAKMHLQYTHLKARLDDANRQLAETTKQAKYGTTTLKKIRDALAVERDRDILPAIKALRGA